MKLTLAFLVGFGAGILVGPWFVFWRSGNSAADVAWREPYDGEALGV